MLDLDYSNMDMETILKVIGARQHPLKSKVIQLLSVYTELSTSQLVEKLGRSKPTILKHLNDLVELGEVQLRKEVSPGAYDKNVYSLKRSSFSIQGQNLHDEVRKNPYFVNEYNNYRLSELLLLKDIVDSMVQYQNQLNEVVQEELRSEQVNPERIIEIMKDNLGSSNLQYLTEKELFKIGNDENKEYLKVRLILPIRRLIEQLARKEWELDGTLWNYPK